MLNKGIFVLCLLCCKYQGGGANKSEKIKKRKKVFWFYESWVDNSQTKVFCFPVLARHTIYIDHFNVHLNTNKRKKTHHLNVQLQD